MKFAARVARADACAPADARRDGATAAKEALKPKKKTMTTSEATEILHMGDADATNMAVIEERYKRLFEVNDPANGGSFYLQSKVYRAHEALVSEVKAAEAAANAAKGPPPGGPAP